MGSRPISISSSDKPESNTSLSKVAVPVTVALAAGWGIASLVYGAGTKVGSEEKDIAYLTSKCDTLAAVIKEGLKEDKDLIRADHESITEMRFKLEAISEHLDDAENGKKK